MTDIRLYAIATPDNPDRALLSAQAKSIDGADLGGFLFISLDLNELRKVLRGLDCDEREREE